ncbi:MAG: hypothetical protein ACLQPD_18660 [Desulfomonilaceae bacterium]
MDDDNVIKPDLIRWASDWSRCYEPDQADIDQNSANKERSEQHV